MLTDRKFVGFCCKFYLHFLFAYLLILSVITVLHDVMAGPVSYASRSECVSIKHILRGVAAEWCYSSRADQVVGGFPVADGRQANVLLRDHWPGRDRQFRHVVPEPHGGSQRRKDCDEVPAFWCEAGPDRDYNAVRGTAGLPCTVHGF